MEARAGLPAVSLDRLQRGVDALRARPRIAVAPASGGELPRLDPDLPLEEADGIEYLHGGPLFIHEMSHIWIDFRGIQDEYMRARGIDYFENSRRAAHLQREYAIRNPKGFAGYRENCWGITASNGPGPARRRIDGRQRRFYGYHARGAPFGPDDGTLAPWATVAALPFAPEIVLPAIDHYFEGYPEMVTEHGITCSFNPTFRIGSARHGWVSGGHYSLDQGPVVLMIENHRSELVWRLMRKCGAIARGLERAGFRGGWLDRPDSVISSS
jgi:hypothetical protein